jgi:AcrR family transcriptional regulator
LRQSDPESSLRVKAPEMSANGGNSDDPIGTRDRRRTTRSHAAILAATTALLTEVGYSHLTIEGIAARARVGKATVYRWWPSKGALAIDAISRDLTVPAATVTGDVRQDLLAAIRRTIHILASSPVGAVIPALTADLVHDPALAQQFREEILRPRRSVVIDVLHHAVDRGELPANLDVELLMDIYVGAVFYRVVVSGEPVTDTLAEQLVGLILDGRQPVKPPRDEGPRAADDS